MVVNNKLTYPDLVRLCKMILDSKFSQKYQRDLILAIITEKDGEWVE